MAHKFLIDGFISGRIKPGARPKDVWESNPEFGKYPLPSFRSAFNRNKNITGKFMQAEIGTGGQYNRC